MRVGRVAIAAVMALAISGCDRGRTSVETATLRSDWSAVLKETQARSGLSPEHTLLRCSYELDELLGTKLRALYQRGSSPVRPGDGA